MISINVPLLAAIKLEDKCGFHFSIMLLSEERIIIKGLELKKYIYVLLLSQDTKTIEVGAITSGIILKQNCILMFKLV